MNFDLDKLQSYDYQCMTNMLERLGGQLNKPSYRFMKGEAICIALEKATDGYLKYVDEEGYDMITPDGVKYEVRSEANCFYARKDAVKKGTILKNGNGVGEFTKNFDYLLRIDSNPERMRIAAFTWETCKEHCYAAGDQWKLDAIPVEYWIDEGRTQPSGLSEVKIDFRPVMERLF